MAEKDINLKQVLKRFPPGDRWTPANAEQPVFANLTEGIEWVFQQTKEHDYVISQNLNQNQLKHLTYMENLNNQGKTEEQVRSSQLGAFIGFIGIMIVCLVAVIVDGIMKWWI